MTAGGFYFAWEDIIRGNYNDFKEARSKEFELFDFKYDAQSARA